MGIDEIKTVLERTPGLEPDDPNLNLGATIKPTVILGPEDAPTVAAALTPRQGAEGEGTVGAPDSSSDYEILGLLGRGGMGIVHRARQPLLQREVAVKRLQEGTVSRSAMERAFLAESLITGALEHPNIVPIYELRDRGRGELWLVMKRIDGRTLTELLAEDPLPGRLERLDRYLGIVLDVCDALAFAHDRGILHRDVKPDNVMTGSFGEVLLLDWGIAVRFGEEPLPQEARQVVPRAAEQRQVAGSPRYMAPEMAEGRGEELGPWTDVYLLGATLHEILSGKAPHAGRSLLEVVTNASRGEPPPLLPEVPVELQAICRRALAREPGARYPTVEALQRDLRDFLEHRESRALATHAREELRRWRDVIDRGVAPEERLRLYTGMGEVLASFRHALELWPGNQDAARGVAEARRHYAEAALEGGDLAVAEIAAEGLEGEEAKGLEARLGSAREQRRRHRSLARWLGAGLIAFQALLIAGLGAFGYWELQRFTHEEIVEQLERLHPAAGAALAGVPTLDDQALDSVADTLGHGQELHIVLLALDGTVLADSHGEPGRAHPAPDLRELLAAATGEGVAVRDSAELGVEVVALARPWRHPSGAEGVLVTSLPRDTLDGPLHRVLVVGLVVLALSFLVWALLVRRVTRRLAASAQRFG